MEQKNVFRIVRWFVWCLVLVALAPMPSSGSLQAWWDEMDPPDQIVPGVGLVFPVREILPAQSLCTETTVGPQVRLLGWEFDPLCQPEPLYLPLTLRLTDYAQGQSGYYLVQFQGPILPEWKEAVSKTGAVLLDYLPDFTFITRMDTATRSRLAALPMVRWVGIYQPGYRVDVILLTETQEQSDIQTEPRDLLVSIFPGEDIDLIQDQIKSLGGQVVEFSENSLGTVMQVRVAISAVDSLARVNGVRWVQAYPERVLHNDVARSDSIMKAESIWADLGLYGQGQIVAVSDTGLDTGNLGAIHNDFRGNPTGCTGTDRIVATYALGRTGDWSDSCYNTTYGNEGGHGTHVSGSVLGNGCRSGNQDGLPPYTNAYAGLAPQASLVMQSVMDSSCGLGGLPSDLNTLFLQAYNAGARVHTNSWGSAEAGQYSVDSQNVDLFMWDHPDYTILFSAGNDGVDANTSNGVVDLSNLGSPASAKNCITVGASENVRASGGYNPGGACSTWGGCWSLDYPTNPINTDPLSNNSAGMAAFSSRGPTADGRYKPDIVAPGTNILSTKSQGTYVSGGWGAGPNQYYQYMGGTSMSTPLTAGATALVREFFTDIKQYTPSAALIKATLANGATDLYPGQYSSPYLEQSTARPNNVQGWGRVNLVDSLNPASPRAAYYFDVADGIQTDEWDKFRFDLSDASEPLRTTLAWTDYPGTLSAGGALVNDLDIHVDNPDATRSYATNAVKRANVWTGIYDTDPYYVVTTNSSSEKYAVKFTPVRGYPAYVDQALIFAYSARKVGNTWYTDYPIDYTLEVFDDNGSGNSPGTRLYGPATVRATAAGWVAVDIPDIMIADGSFYISYQPQKSAGRRLVQDVALSSSRSWYYNGSTWSAWTGYGDLSIRVVTKAQNPTTNYDRVNNLVGVDLGTPLQTGNYTVTVTGYNVAQGPQPYALVTSGAVAFNASSSYRILAGGDTAQRTFGRTGVQMDFSSGPGGNVTVNMYKDYSSHSPTGSAAFMKVNWDISTLMGEDTFDAQLVFHYDEADLPSGMTEAEIQGAYRYNGTSWVGPQGTVDTTANTVTVDNVTAFSNWTLGQGTPTIVTLSHFEATPAEDGIELVWETASEIDVLGFNLYRSQALDGSYALLNAAPIAAKEPGSVLGTVYTWVDENVQPGIIYYYKLESIDTYGISTFRGPVWAALTFKQSTVYLPIAIKP